MEHFYCSETRLPQSILVQHWAGGSAVCNVCQKQKKGSVIPFYDMKIFYENILQQIVSAIIFTLMG